jgi:hypothetical protein
MCVLRWIQWHCGTACSNVHVPLWFVADNHASSLVLLAWRRSTRLVSSHSDQQQLDVRDWLIDYDGVRLTSQNGGHHWPIVRPPRVCEWRAVVMMLAGENSRLVYQSSLAVLPAETSGASRRNGRRNENFAYSVSLIRQRIFYMP